MGRLYRLKDTADWEDNPEYLYTVRKDNEWPEARDSHLDCIHCINWDERWVTDRSYIQMVCKLDQDYQLVEDFG